MVAFLSFSGPLTSVAKVSESKTCVSLNNQPCITRSTIIALKPCEKGFHYYTFLVELDRCDLVEILLNCLYCIKLVHAIKKSPTKVFFFNPVEKFLAFSPEKKVFLVPFEECNQLARPKISYSYPVKKISYAFLEKPQIFKVRKVFYHNFQKKKKKPQIRWLAQGFLRLSEIKSYTYVKKVTVF